MTGSVGNTILVTRRDAVATVTFSRPERLNAFDGDTVDAFHAVVHELAADDSVRAVVLTGAGRGFCAGGDVEGLATGGTGGGTDEGARPPLRVTMQISEQLRAMPKVTIAAVNGPCAGAGLSFACACDLRYAAASAVFVTAFLRVGSPGDHGSAWLLTRAVGAARARELLLLGGRVDATEALRIGLVSAVLPDAELLDHVGGIAARLAQAAPHALAAMKANLEDAVTLPLGTYLDHETERFEATLGSPEARAAAQAFLDRE